MFTTMSSLTHVVDSTDVSARNEKFISTRVVTALDRGKKWRRPAVLYKKYGFRYVEVRRSD